MNSLHTAARSPGNWTNGMCGNIPLNLLGEDTFLWRDYAHGNRVKPMTIPATEFIRRFLLHILPGGFRKIRHYGLAAARGKTGRLALCRRLTNTKPPQRFTAVDSRRKMLGPDFKLCPYCKTGHLSREPPCFS